MTSIRDHELPEIFYKGLPVELIIGELELIDDIQKVFKKTDAQIRVKYGNTPEECLFLRK